MKLLSLSMSLIGLCLTSCITSGTVKGYGWSEVKGNWTLQGVYSYRGDNDCSDHSDPYFYHSSYPDSPTPVLYCKINFQPVSYRIDYPEFIVYLHNEVYDGVIHYDGTHSADSSFVSIKFSTYLIDPLLGKRYIKDTTQLMEMGTLIHDESPNDTLHLFEGSNQNILKVLVRIP